MALMAKGWAQLGDQKFPSFFGLQIKTLIPTNFIGDVQTTVSKDGFKSTISQNIGYSFGATVRAGITELIAFETGINFNQRYFDIQSSYADSGIFVSNQLGFIHYDVPINGLIYIKLSKRLYANASLGLAAGFKPTSIGTLNNAGGTTYIFHTGAVTKKISLDLNGNLGAEYRSKKSGTFYLGGSIRLPLKPLFTYISTYKNQGYKATGYGDVSGGYLSIDLKYFFKNVRGQSPIKVPIE